MSFHELCYLAQNEQYEHNEKVVYHLVMRKWLKKQQRICGKFRFPEVDHRKHKRD